MAFRIRKPSQESFFALNAIPLYSYAIPLRKDGGESGRFRPFTRADIAKRNDNLDISWLRDDEAQAEGTLNEPEDIAAAILGHLRAALSEIEAVADELAEAAKAEK